MSNPYDPITLEIIQNSLQAAADEMHIQPPVLKPTIAVVRNYLKQSFTLQLSGLSSRPSSPMR